MIKAAVGDTIRELRIRRGLSLEALAEATGIGRVELVRIEAGTTRPDQVRLSLIAYALDVSVDELTAVSLESAASRKILDHLDQVRRWIEDNNREMALAHLDSAIALFTR